MAIPRERSAVRQALRAAFPSHFTEYTQVDLGVGWLPLVAPLLESLSATVPFFTLDGIKERRGKLHIWLTSGSLGEDAEVRREAELQVHAVIAKAAKVCSFCGLAEKEPEASLCHSCNDSFACFLA